VTIVDRLIASDPPLERLRLALRATATVLLAAGLVVPLLRAGIVPGPSALLGVMTGMWATLIVNDAELRARRVTSALVPVSAAVSVSLAASFDVRSQLLGAVLFVAVTFAGVWIRRYGRRGFALGQAAVFVMLFSLFLRIAPAQLPMTYLAMLIGAAAAFVVRYAIVTDDARVVMRGALAGFAARMRLVQRAGADFVAANDERTERALRRALAPLNDAAIALDRLVAGHVFLPGDAARRDARVALLEAELAADAFVRGALAHRADDPRSRTEAVAERRDVLDRAVVRARDALHAVLRAPVAPGADAPISAMPSPPAIGRPSPTTRLAIQAAATSVLAMTFGTLVPPHLFFWAVLTAFLVFTGTASAAEARRRAWGRAVGTTIGVALAFALVALVHGRPVVEGALAVVSFFLSMYTFRVSYAAFTFFITALVAMMYELVGRPPQPLLFARLVETIVGSLCGTVAATLVLPLRTRDVVAATAKDYVEKLAAAVHASAARLGAREGDDPLDATRAADASLHEVIARLEPLVEHAHGPARNAACATLDALIESAYRARDLCDRALRSSGAADGALEPLQRAANAVEAALHAFATVLDGRPEIVADEVAPANAAEAAAAQRRAPPDVAEAAHDLRLIAERVALLAEPASTLRGAR